MAKLTLPSSTHPNITLCSMVILFPLVTRRSARQEVQSRSRQEARGQEGQSRRGRGSEEQARRG